MSDLIGKEVYAKVIDNTYGYSSSGEWSKGTIVGGFIDGDVLVKVEDKLYRDIQVDIAFTKDAEIPPVVKATKVKD